MSGIDLSVLIVSYGGAELLRECLKSLPAGARGLTWEAVVVENHPSGAAAELVAREFPQARLVRNAENAGYSRGNNQAAALARGRTLLLLNPDARLEPGAGAALVRFLDSRPKAGAAGARLLNADGTLQPSTYPDLSLGVEALRLARASRWLPRGAAGRLFLGSSWAHDAARAVPRITGACLMIRREAWEDVGGLSEEFFVYGGTHDWCLRARRRGWTIWFCPEATAVHAGGRSTAEAWGEVDRRRRMLEAHDLLLRLHRGAAFAWTWWVLSWLGDLTALALSPLTRPPSDQRELLRREASWLTRRLAGGGFARER